MSARTWGLPGQRHWVVALMVVLGCFLYIPFLENPLIFDDINIFHTAVLTQAAIAPWELGPRGLPYFTLGWVQTQIGSMSTHRVLSLGLHLLVSYQLFRFLETVLPPDPESARHPHDANEAAPTHWLAVLIAAAFLCHPVATYAAGYLVQRTTVCATLFTLLCLRCLLPALRQNRIGLAASAAVWASLAILSKEHSVAVPVASLCLVLLVPNPDWKTAKTGGLFLLMSLPAMVFALRTSLHAVGHGYEPGLQEMESELHALPSFSGGYERWLFSASHQAELFFSYWRQWLLPDLRDMSIDLRVDFLRPWNHAKAWMWIGAWACAPLIGVAVSLKMRRYKLAAFALAFTAVLFTVELGTVRLQEPYVLYRSYIWSIGYCTFAAALFAQIPGRLGLICLALAIPLLLLQSRDRLSSFQTPLALWQDAAAKLPKLEIAGSGRILFNLGRERFRSGDVESAKNLIDQAVLLSPQNGSYRIARANALLRLARPAEALLDLEIAKKALPRDGRLLFAEYLALSALGRSAEAQSSLVNAELHGSLAAKSELARLRSLQGSTAGQK